MTIKSNDMEIVEIPIIIAAIIIMVNRKNTLTTFLFSPVLCFVRLKIPELIIGFSHNAIKIIIQVIGF